jgi:hypothetical protein
LFLEPRQQCCCLSNLSVFDIAANIPSTEFTRLKNMLKKTKAKVEIVAIINHALGNAITIREEMGLGWFQ